ncbi:hypothetical protein VNO78_17987 [Psophocarpus tetragonolobus]|uniref:Uncharacterized protein n=1 Tax=Psophocarpus tetragonolobus TaxID=3891 RepID=A0AAN9SP45_PSOTE
MENREQRTENREWNCYWLVQVEKLSGTKRTFTVYARQRRRMLTATEYESTTFHPSAYIGLTSSRAWALSPL